MAKVTRKEGETCLGTKHDTIRLTGIGAEYFDYLYEHATGRETIAELVTAEFNEELLLSLTNQLERVGVCYEAHLLAQVGQWAANYPDLRQTLLGEAAIRLLMVLPEDPLGEFVPTDGHTGAVLHRETSQGFTDQPLAFDEIAQIAHAGYGIIEDCDDTRRRVVPSAGAMYPLQVDYLVRRGEGIRSGHYRWAKHRNGFIYLGQPEDELVQRSFFGDRWLQAPLIQVISYDIGRSARKYESRAHRFALIEAGHVAQASMFRATELGLGSGEFGGYADVNMLELIGVDQITGGMATVVFYGRTV